MVDNMPKKSLYKPKIEKELKKSSHNFKNLYMIVKNIKTFNTPNKSFQEALMNLLQENSISITGYDFTVHAVKDNRYQSFKKEGIVFEWVKTEQTYIYALLNQLESINTNILDESSLNHSKLKNKLFQIFNKKYREYEKQEYYFYEEIKNLVTCETSKDNLNRDKILLKKKLSECEGDPDLSPEISELKDKIENNEKGVKKYPNLRWWIIEGKENIKKYNNLLKAKGLPTNNVRIIGRDDVLAFGDNDYYGSNTVEGIFEGLWNIRVEIKTPEEVKSLFNRLLFFIYNHENSNFIKQSFSWALSDEEDSMEWFELFIKVKDLTNKNLRTELGIKNDFERLQEMIDKNSNNF